MACILLVEDNELNRDVIARYLALFEHEVITAGGGEEAIATARARSTDLDLVLMDINLPKTDGFETTRRLKSHELTRSLPVVALTAHAMVGDREKALEAGCDGYLTKPVNFGVLLGKIDSLVRKAVAS